jgi:hypothetical protein
MLDGDHIMPIMDRLYGFTEFKTVMRAQVVHNCVNEGNANAAINVLDTQFLGYELPHPCILFFRGRGATAQVGP